MVMEYKGYRVTLKKLKKVIALPKKARGPKIVSGLLSLGINAKLLIYAPHIFKNFSEPELRFIGKSHKDDYIKKYAKYLLKIIDVVEHKQIDTELIKSFLKRKIPPIVSVNSAVLRNRSYGKFVAHYVVVKGFKRDYFILNDPHPKFGGVLKVRRDTLIASIYSRKIPEMVIIE
jgi:hypothetical protein